MRHWLVMCVMMKCGSQLGDEREFLIGGRLPVGMRIISSSSAEGWCCFIDENKLHSVSWQLCMQVKHSK